MRAGPHQWRGMAPELFHTTFKYNFSIRLRAQGQSGGGRARGLREQKEHTWGAFGTGPVTAVLARALFAFGTPPAALAPALRLERSAGLRLHIRLSGRERERTKGRPLPYQSPRWSGSSPAAAWRLPDPSAWHPARRPTPHQSRYIFCISAFPAALRPPAGLWRARGVWRWALFGSMHGPECCACRAALLGAVA